MADSVPPKKRKPLFKRTALRKAPAADNDDKEDDDNDNDGLDLFRRSKEMAPIVAAEQERRFKKSQQKEQAERRRLSAERRAHDSEQQQHAEHEASPASEHATPGGGMREDSTTADMNNETVSPRKSTSTSSKHRDSELATPPPSKRSRLDSSCTDAHGTASPESNPMVKASPSTRTQSQQSPQPQQEKSPFTPDKKAIISLVDSDSEKEEEKKSEPAASTTPFSPRDRSSSSSLEIPEAPPSELDEFIRRAEEKRARERALLAASSSSGSHAPPPPAETTKILVTSCIPDSKPVMIKFPFSKALRIARQAWVTTQINKGVVLPCAQEDFVLTWRRSKVYSHSTLDTLGIRPQGNGQLTTEDHSRDGLASDRTAVCMEVWTPDQLREAEEEEMRRRMREAGELSDESCDDDNDEAKANKRQEALLPEVKIRVVLKAPDFEPVKLSVRPETTVETLLTGFRTQRSLGNDHLVSLWFDGELLEEHTTMGDADIEDMDTIDVHVKPANKG